MTLIAIAECLNVAFKSIMLSVIMLDVIMLSIVVSLYYTKEPNLKKFKSLSVVKTIRWHLSLNFDSPAVF
jgi:hypothetical protein